MNWFNHSTHQTPQPSEMTSQMMSRREIKRLFARQKASRFPALFLGSDSIPGAYGSARLDHIFRCEGRLNDRGS